MSLYVKETSTADSITTPASKITDLQNQINTLNSALNRKSNLYDEGFSLYFRTVATDFNDRIEALKNSIQNETMKWDRRCNYLLCNIK